MAGAGKLAGCPLRSYPAALLSLHATNCCSHGLLRVLPKLPAPPAGSSPSGKLVVDLGKLQPMSRLGGNTYGRVSGCFDLPRPDRTT